MDYIIKSAEIEKMPGLKKTHFLNPDATRLNKSLGDAVGLNNIGFHIIELQPGAESTEYHVHYNEEECVYILEGQATVIIDEQSYDVEAGDFIGYPASGLAHTMINTGNTVLKCIVVGQRLPYDVGDYPRKGKRIYRTPAGNDLVDLSQTEHPTMGVRK